MKHLAFYAFILIVMSITFSSCTAYKTVREIDVVDYAPYTQSGFLITESNTISYDYIPLGSVSVKLGGVARAEQNAMKYSVKGERGSSKYYSADDALKLLVSKSLEKGANGIINLKVSIAVEPNIGYIYTLTGMAIMGQPKSK